jgi:glycosyltransferase involved in cell wall biosynthesis
LCRIHPDKGVHLAIEVARASSKHLIIAGIVQNTSYFESQIKPQIDGRSVSYVG